MKHSTSEKTGSLTFTDLANGQMAYAFIPDNFYENGPYHHTVPYRKPPRQIAEIVPGFLWADAADFQDYGGWALDTQHFGFMGSSYLLAHGAGKPVEPARLTLAEVCPGKYRLWVRCRDWFPAHSPGQFAVAMDGREVGPVFGCARDDAWAWRDGGEHELAGGECTIELRDRTGFFGRCSSLLLTRELAYTPPSELKAFRAERARLSGHTNEFVTLPEFDVVVVGAGTAGCCAAIAAARMGVKTALITDRPLLGGNASVEIGVPTQGAAMFHRAARETGIVEEAGRIGFARDWGNAKVLSRQFGHLAAAEPNLSVFTDLFIDEVEKDGGHRIRAALARNVLTGEPFRFPGKIFIDTSGDAWLGHFAGAEERFGREARSEYGESQAPEVADSVTLSGCLRGPLEEFKSCLFIRTLQADSPRPFEPPPWIYQNMPSFDDWRLERGNDDEMVSYARIGTWWVEHPGEVDDLNEPEKARDELIRCVYTFWHLVKNEWSARDRIAHFELIYVPFVVGKRETRRLMGDYVLNQNDVMQPVHFDDAIGHSGWMLDIHHPDGMYSTGGPFNFSNLLPISEIPYRSLYSRNIENLMVAGRNASISHVAMGTTRVQGQTCVMGEAAGVAAAMAIKQGTTPRGVGEKHLRKLQQTLLKCDVYIPGVVNQDPDDLARRASVSASSYDNGQPLNLLRYPKPGQESEWSKVVAVAEKDWLSLDSKRAVSLPWKAGTPIEKIALRLRAPAGGELLIQVLECPAEGLPDATQTVARMSQTLPAQTEGWVHFPVAATPGTDHLVIAVQSAADMQWAREYAQVDGFRHWSDTGSGWSAGEQGMMTVDITPPLPFPAMGPARPELIINGIARPVFPTPFASIHQRYWEQVPDWVQGSPLPMMNSWQSAPGKALPQWIELAWEEPQTIGCVHCVFDTDLDLPLAKQREAFPGVCVRAYRIEYEVDGQWRKVVAETDNFQRLRRHSFDPVRTRKLRLTVESTHGAPFARIFEIRAYKTATPFAAGAGN